MFEGSDNKSRYSVKRSREISEIPNIHFGYSVGPEDRGGTKGKENKKYRFTVETIRRMRKERKEEKNKKISSLPTIGG